MVRGNNLAPKFVLFCQTSLNTITRFAMQTGYYIGKKRQKYERME